MEYGSRIRFIIFTVISVVLLVLSTWGIVSIAKNIFGGDSTKSNASVQKIELSDYEREGTAVKLNVEGPIVGDDQFLSYQREVTQNYRKFTIYKGYQKSVVSEKQYSNNIVAYRIFLRALERSNFTNKVAGASDDEVAACATGRRYVYSLSDHDETISRLWNASCSTKSSTSMQSSNGSSVRALFKSQIPDYSTILVKEYTVLN